MMYSYQYIELQTEVASQPGYHLEVHSSSRGFKILFRDSCLGWTLALYTMLMESCVHDSTSCYVLRSISRDSMESKWVVFKLSCRRILFRFTLLRFFDQLTGQDQAEITLLQVLQWTTSLINKMQPSQVHSSGCCIYHTCIYKWL